MDKKYKLSYLASPYSFDGWFGRWIRKSRFDLVSEAAVRLLQRGEYVFSPIAYNHPMVKFRLPTDWAFWEGYDTAFIERCDSLIVFQLDGWKESVGVSAEVAIAKELKIPITYLSPEKIGIKQKKWISVYLNIRRKLGLL